MTIIGLDIGGTKIEGILWGGGKIFKEKKIETPKNRRQFLKELIALVAHLKGKKKIEGIGISCAGAIEDKTGKILNSPNMKFLNGLRLANVFAKKFRVKARIENDTNCFLLGEARFGAARGKQNIVALTLGTGVGGAVLVEGELLSGIHGTAGELGHMVIASSNSPFAPSFEKRGEGEFYTVEDLCSSHFFKKFKLGGALDVQHKAEAGNKKAKQIYKMLGRNLGIGLANFVNIFDPGLIILGGGISRGAHLFLQEALSEMKKHALVSLQKMLPQVKISKLKYAGALGAVSLLTKP